jgi:filamentous hemagglutinin family protein
MKKPMMISTFRLLPRVVPPRFAASMALPLVLALSGVSGPSLRANPSGGRVVAGEAAFSSSGSTLTIHQGSDRAIIHWQDFSIPGGSTTRFVQPSGASAVLNRVTGGNPSAIHGTLSANGQVYLINPNGILVGSGGVVDTAGFLASTLDVSDAAFLRGGDLRFSGNSKASVVNLGRIGASEGDVILIARTVENHGEIHAPNGTAALAAGSEVLVKASGEERVFIEAGNASEASSATQAGLIAAAAAEIKAAGGNEYALAIKHTGVTRATGVSKSGGRVFLSAGGKSRLSQTGKIQARNPDGGGGTVRIEAARIEVGSTAVIDASADSNSSNGEGGTILAGGGLRGEDVSIGNAEQLVIDDGAQIHADGSGRGGGGEVVLWADGRTDFSGAVSARGGVDGGRGGFVEVSGKEVLNFRGLVDTGGGTLLLDPTNITIQASTGNQDNTWSAGQIDAALQSNNLVLQADQDITWSGDASLTYTNLADRNLTLQAGRNILFTLVSSNGASILPGVGAGRLGIVLNADRDTSGSGNIRLFNTTIDSNGGDIVFGGGVNPLTTAAVGSGTGSDAQKAGVFLSGSTLRSGTGSISLRGRGIAGASNAYGVAVTGGSRIESSSGPITLHGTGATGVQQNHGVFLTGANTVVTSATGAISITGTGGGGTGGDHHGISLTSAASITSTGTGAGAATVTLHGTGGAGTLQNRGVFLSGVDTAVTSEDGAISVTGIGGAGSGGDNHGIALTSAATITSTGTGADAAMVTLHGTGGAGTQQNHGVFLSDANTEVTSVVGALSVTGVGGAGSGSSNDGIHLSAASRITSTGTGASAATLTLHGTGGAGTQQNRGIFLTGAGTTVTSADGSLSLTGVGAGGSGSTGSNHGIHLASGARLVSTATGMGAPSVTLHGTGGPGSANNLGVWLEGANTAVTSVDSAISATGVAGANTTTGVRLSTSASVGGPATTGAILLQTPDEISLQGGAVIQSIGTGTPVVLSAGGNFINTAGAGAVLAPNGRWLIYSNGVVGNDFGGLLSGNLALHERTFATAPPESVTEPGNRYLFAAAPPSLTVTSLSAGKTYGDTYSFASPVVGTDYSITGFIDASIYGGAFTQDSVAILGLSGAPVLMSAGAAATAGVGASPYVINLDVGTLENTAGFVFGTFTPSGTLAVSPREITVTAIGGTSIYGDSPANPGLSATNLASFDTVTALTGLSNSFGIDSTTTVAAYTLSVAGTLTNGNYEVTSTHTGTWDVTKKALSITANPASKTFGDAFAFVGTEFETEGLINGDTVTSANFASAGAIAVAFVAGGPYPILINGASGSGLGNYEITYSNSLLTVNPRPVIVTALGGSSTYGESPANPGISATNLARTDTLAALTGLFNSSEISATTPAGIYPLNVSGVLTNSNYVVESAIGGTWTVALKALTITANDRIKTYGDGFVFQGTEFSVVGLVNEDAVTMADLASEGSIPEANVPGGPYVISIADATGTGLENYDIQYIDGRMQVLPRGIVVLSRGGRSVAGSKPRIPGLRVKNLASFDSIAVIQGLKNRLSVTRRSPAGVYRTQIAGRLGNPNYVVIRKIRGKWRVK